MTYNITDYGAEAGGRLCTKEIQSTIDACFLAGGGEVAIPEGDFITGGLRLRSNVTLHLLENAYLVGSIDPEDYLTYLNDEIEPIAEDVRDMVTPTALPDCTSKSARPYSRWNNAIIRAINAENIAIIGEKGSVIDGRNCFDAIGEEQYRGPHAINIWFAKNITLRGYTIKDSANWAHAIQNSQNITCKNVTVLGGHDGFDVRTCDDVLVEDCRFLTGDDCIAGFDNIGVTVRNCYFESACSLLRFGGTDVLVENCRGKDPATYGFRGNLTPEQKTNRADTDENCRHICHNVYLYYCDLRANIRKTPGNIVFRNCNFDGIKTILNHPYGHVWCRNKPLDNITFDGCVFNGLSDTSRTTNPPDEKLTVNIKNCTLIARDGYEKTTLIESHNLEKLVFDNTKFENFEEIKVSSMPECKIECINCQEVKLVTNNNSPTEGF